MTTTKSNIFFIILFVVMTTIFVACDNHLEHEVSEIEVPEVPTETVSFTEDELLVLMQMRNPDNRICIDEATEIAIDAISFFNAGNTTRSGEIRRVANIAALRGEPTTRMTTRASDERVEVKMPDTLAYVFNFADDAGFAIIAADTRIESPILAFVEDGSLDLSKEIDHPGLAIFLSGAEEYIERSIIESEQRRDSLLADILTKIEVVGVMDTVYLDDAATRRGDSEWRTGETTTISGGPWITDSRMGPLSTVEWGQSFPYNDLVKSKKCTNPSSYLPFTSCDLVVPTGCVATATAMLMAYWGEPAQIDGYNMDWGLLNEYTGGNSNVHENIWGKLVIPTTLPARLSGRQVLFSNNVSRLMERIGHHVGMNYGCSKHGGSGIANMQKMVNFLHKMGYTGGCEENYNTRVVINSLNNRHPVLASGFRDRTLFVPHTGHTWLIDGYLRQRQQIMITVTITDVAQGPAGPFLRTRTMITTETVYSSYYLHNNWGWNGSYNGFFVAGSFHVGDEFGSNARSVPMEDRNYQYKNKIFPNIKLK
ncbi:MAG: C10 family peptidase [Dysgonamonadaceae bacterium]|jgi:hypothetical protein|nr:C10 family peptidase [Dysgonamonadaceae bacterium]